MASKTKVQFTVTSAELLGRTVYVVLDGDAPIFATFSEAKANKRAAYRNAPTEA